MALEVLLRTMLYFSVVMYYIGSIEILTVMSNKKTQSMESHAFMRQLSSFTILRLFLESLLNP